MNKQILLSLLGVLLVSLISAQAIETINCLPPTSGFQAIDKPLDDDIAVSGSYIYRRVNIVWEDERNIFQKIWDWISTLSKEQYIQIELNTYATFDIPFNYSQTTCPDFLPGEATCFVGERGDERFIFYGTIEKGDFVIHYLPLQTFTEDNS